MRYDVVITDGGRPWLTERNVSRRTADSIAGLIREAAEEFGCDYRATIRPHERRTRCRNDAGIMAPSGHEWTLETIQEFSAN